jgi:hypothetical protein
MSTDNDQPFVLTPPPRTPAPEGHSNRTAWTVVAVVALVALQADAAGASSWHVVDGRCITS